MKIPPSINRTTEGQYCLHCYSTKVERAFKDGKTYYFCGDCQNTNERSLVIDNSINWWVDNENNYWHESVGVVILNNKNELLAIMRTIYPFAYSLPAGHLEKGEEPLTAAQREVKEEVGINIPKESFKLIQEFQLPGDSCRRGGDHHLWHLYSAKTNHSANAVKLNDEASGFRWFNLDEITSSDDITYPLRYIVENLRNKFI